MRRSLKAVLATLGGGALAAGGGIVYVSATAAPPASASKQLDAQLSNFQAQSGGQLLSGARLPTDRLGTTGDFYFRTGTDQLFGPKTLNVVHPWGAVGLPLRTLNGRAGAPGVRGPAGPAGPAGPKGTPGTSILNGRTAPTTQGATGDFYLDTSDDVLYGPKASGRWPSSGVSLVGTSGTPSTQTVVVKRTSMTVVSTGTATAVASCTSGNVVTGGGYTSTVGAVQVQNDAPVLNGSTWQWKVTVTNTTASNKATVTVYAVCAPGAGHFT